MENLPASLTKLTLKQNKQIICKRLGLQSEIFGQVMRIFYFHGQDQDGDFALFWTSVGAQMSLWFSAEVNTDVYVYKVMFLPKM